MSVTGTVTEFNGLTELTEVDVTVQGRDSLLQPASSLLPVEAIADLEAFEGMQVTIPNALLVTEFFELDRSGQVVLAANDSVSNAPGTDGRLDQYTQRRIPNAKFKNRSMLV